MNRWNVVYSEDAKEDLKRLDGSRRIIAEKMIRKVSENPVSVKEGGYGKPLGNHNASKLAGFYKVKNRSSGIRIVYQLKEIDGVMYIVIIGLREAVYEDAQKRIR